MCKAYLARAALDVTQPLSLVAAAEHMLLYEPWLRRCSLDSLGMGTMEKSSAQLKTVS